MTEPTIRREPSLYSSGAYPGEEGEEYQIFKMCRRFDGTDEGDFNAELIREANERIASLDEFSGFRFEPRPIDVWPQRIIIVDASKDRLPLSSETTRVVKHRLEELGHPEIEVVKVDITDELVAEAAVSPSGTMLLSQCVQSKVYNVDVCHGLEKDGLVCLPGATTAPFGPFTYKERTYALLDDPENRVIARYREIVPSEKTREEVAASILDTAVAMKAELGSSLFFVKPTVGGSGLGGFRVEVRDDGFFIPDLSKVTGIEKEGIEPVWIDFDPENGDQMRELVYTFRLFEDDPNVVASYLRLTLDDLRGMYDTDDDLEAMTQHIRRTQTARQQEWAGSVYSREEAVSALTDAFVLFEEKFNVRYHPLVNEHMHFGTWGFRVHVRLTRRGPEIETIYARIFQMALTKDGIGYVGSDNISNSQTGKLEILRCGPLHPLQVAAIGGRDALMENLLVAARGFTRLLMEEPESTRRLLPFRAELDIAPPSRMICEGNADPARGLCIAGRWSMFVDNTNEWLEDALGRYSSVRSE